MLLQELNFDAPTGVVESTFEPKSASVMTETAAQGVSIGLCLTALLLVVLVTRKILKPSSGTDANTQKPTGPRQKQYHLLSFLVCTFLLLNVAFGGMTAFLLGRTTEDSRAYFAEISAFKLAKLSHEHFFGYGTSFGILTALSFLFVSSIKKRVLMPSLLMFVFGSLDVASWWLSRFVSFGFHALTYATGAVFALSFFVLYLQLCNVHFRNMFTRSKRN